ncbi:MAG: Glutathione S-transferase domain protein [Ramlibacter sp.]|nr:Glutathione S-transferase domain protein [Ramlibacter sp.]
MERLVLRTASPSPLGHKVQVVAALLDIPLVVTSANTLDPEDSLRRQNPLGKVPVLLRDDGSALYDSRVIVEFLVCLAATESLIPRERAARIEALRWQALSDGIADAAILIYSEFQWRPQEMRHAPWIGHQAGKVRRALHDVEKNIAVLNASRPDVGSVSLACTLGYLEVRFGRLLRENWPLTFQWLDEFADRVPQFRQGAPQPATFASHLRPVEPELLGKAIFDIAA